jgi:3-oxoacyl-[acyl-carrier protein] reductase
MARRLAAAGCRLALVDLDEAALQSTADECREAGSPKVQGYIANVAKEDEVVALFDDVAADFGAIRA